jgi:hypothetical protein
MNRQLRPTAGDIGLEYELGDAMDEIDSISVRIGFVGDLLQEVCVYLLNQAMFRQQSSREGSVMGLALTCSAHSARLQVVFQLLPIEAFLSTACHCTVFKCTERLDVRFCRLQNPHPAH